MSGFLNRLLFPEVCPLCSRFGKEREIDKQGCCDNCYRKYIYPKEKAVVVLPEFAPCCSTVFCASYYGSGMQEAMKKFKFHGDTYIGKYFGRILYSVLEGTGCLENTDIITAVPISDNRFKERGYNQSFLLAKELSRLSGIKYKDLLVRSRQGTAQSSLLLEERQKIVTSRFEIKENCDIKGNSVLLVDDILTTGSTLNQCSRLLRTAGASWVTGVCVTGGRKDFG